MAMIHFLVQDPLQLNAVTISNINEIEYVSVPIANHCAPLCFSGRHPVLVQGFEFFDGKQIEDRVFHDYEPLIQAWVKHQFWPALRNKVIDMDAIPTRNV